MIDEEKGLTMMVLSKRHNVGSTFIKKKCILGCSGKRIIDEKLLGKKAHNFVNLQFVKKKNSVLYA